LPSDAPGAATVLGFDTSGAWCTAAVIRGDTVLAHERREMARGQGETLMPLLERTLGAAGCHWSNLEALGVGIGPGNFTGIRISVAAARGLALGLGIPAIGVDRFDAAALDAPDRPVAVPALRGQFWMREPGRTPRLVDTPPATAIGEGLVPAAHPLAVAIARLASARRATPQPRPAPLYLRDADAAPPSEAPPAVLD
jgi:tRNA threonylcarbamoyladenosine biosynthesis protein TsaB